MFFYTKWTPGEQRIASQKKVSTHHHLHNYIARHDRHKSRPIDVYIKITSNIIESINTIRHFRVQSVICILFFILDRLDSNQEYFNHSKKKTHTFTRMCGKMKWIHENIEWMPIITYTHLYSSPSLFNRNNYDYINI